jgi:hypothetical protein
MSPGLKQVARKNGNKAPFFLFGLLDEYSIKILEFSFARLVPARKTLALVIFAAERFVLLRSSKGRDGQ